MSTSYGRVRKRVMLSDLNRTGVLNSTLLQQSDINGGLELRFQADSAGCGNPPSLFAAEFKNDINWKQIEIEFNFLGGLACWTFGHTQIIDDYPFPGWTALSNLLPFSSRNYDRVYDGELTYELPQFQISNEVYYVFRCDAQPDNWGNFNTTSYRKFKMIRTRNNMNLPAGMVVGRTCTSTGAQGISILKNMYFIY